MITGLRAGAGPAGELATDALARLGRCLERYASLLSAFAPTEVVAVGTSAVRDAPNRREVADLVRRLLGVDMRVLSGEEEADAAYRGASLSAPGGPRAVVDVGGGSTEIIAGGPSGPSGMVSLDIGGTRCTVGAMAADPPGRRAADELAVRIRETVAARAPRLIHPGPVLGVAGTVTTLAAMDLGAYSPETVDGHRLSAGALRRRARDLAGMSLRERRLIPGLEPARAPVIGTGAVIVSAVVDALGADEIVASERDLLDGLALARLPQTAGSS